DQNVLSLDAVSLILGLAAGLALAIMAGIWPVARMIREKAALSAKLGSEQEGRERIQAEFRLLAQDALKSSQEQFLVLAGEKLKMAQSDGAHDLEKRQNAIADMVKPLQKHLEILGSTVEQIKGTDQMLKDEITSLTRETARLSGALRDPTAQGHWGEYILEGVMEHSGLIKGVHYVTQEAVSAIHRPDAIINLNGGLKIIVDAKTPLNDFISTLGRDLSQDESDQIMKNLAAQVRSHIIALSRKGYWENLENEGVDFTVLFLPSEPLFSMALRADAGLLDLASSKNIILASPTLMMALLRVVRMGWRQADLADNARAISEQGAVLYERLITFADHLGKVGKGLSGAIENYNKAVGSLDRMVFPATRKLQELGVQDGGKTLTKIGEIEEIPRRLAGNE
ncbi:MAG TPA: DNA recombination protein RmuC, partial [Micavibrio sp.]